MPTLVVISLFMGSPPFTLFTSIVGTSVGGLNSFHSSEMHPHTSTLLLALEEVNTVNHVIFAIK
jgi:hypothetical protein